MKLATYKDGSRDGQLVVVSRDLSTAHYATGIAPPCSRCWTTGTSCPQLQDLYVTLNQGKARHAFPFDPRQCMAPLPRAYQWADGSAYLNHVELVRACAQQRSARQLLHRPADVPGRQRRLHRPATTWWCGSEAYGIDFEAELAVITGDVPMGVTPEQAWTASAW
jgi:fumarylacetoacetate (FAA) hydrolase